MKRALLRTVLLLNMAGMAVIAGCRTVPDVDAWGEPVDGHWYAQTYAVFGSARPVDIAPGAQSSFYRRGPSANAIVMSGIGDDQGRRFELAPGQHQIRLGLGQGAFANVLKTGNWLQLASNRIIVNVPEWSASTERDRQIAAVKAAWESQ